MGFFSRLFGSDKKGVNSHNALDFHFYEKLIDNIAVSEDLQSTLKASIKKAFDNPKSFYDDAGYFILSDRQLTYKHDAAFTQKFVLVDNMLEVGQMAEVDWKEEEEEIRFSIIEILEAKEYGLTISTDNKYEGNTPTIIAAINNNELEPGGYSLRVLDINSDSYVFTIVPLEKKHLVRQMFKTLK